MLSHIQISILSGPKGSAVSVTLQASSEIVGFTQVRNKKYMPFQGKNSIKLEVEKAFVIMIPWVTKQNETFGELIDTVLFWALQRSAKSFS